MAHLLSVIGDPLPVSPRLQQSLDAIVAEPQQREQLQLAALMQERFRGWYVGFFDTLTEAGTARTIVASGERPDVVRDVRAWRSADAARAGIQVTIDLIAPPPEESAE